MRLFEHFGLHQNPFHISPDTNFFFSTVAHDRALTQLIDGIENRRGFMLLTGDPGTGKTTVSQYLLDWLRRQDYSSAYIFHPLLTSTDLLEFILRDLGVPISSGTKSDMRSALHRWLLARRDVGDRPVILVDEAQDLRSSALKELYRVLHLEKRPGDLVQVILSGQLSINEKLREPEMTRLRQCLRCRCRLTALTLEETSSFIVSRLQRAGALNLDVFPAETVLMIHGYARGTPRIVNTLCEHALLEALAMGRGAVAPEDIGEVARRLDLAEPAPAERPEILNTFGRLIHFPGPSSSPNLENTELNALPPKPPKTPELVGAAVSAALASLISDETTSHSVESVFLLAGPNLTANLGKRVRGLSKKAAGAGHHLWMASGCWQNWINPAFAAVLMVYWRSVRRSLAEDTHQLMQALRSWKSASKLSRMIDQHIAAYWREILRSLAQDSRRSMNSVFYWWPARARNVTRNQLLASTHGPIAITDAAHRPLSARGRRRLPTSPVATKNALAGTPVRQHRNSKLEQSDKLSHPAFSFGRGLR